MGVPCDNTVLAAVIVLAQQVQKNCVLLGMAGLLILFVLSLLENEKKILETFQRFKTACPDQLL